LLQISKESYVTDPILLETTINKEIKALTGYDPTKFSYCYHYNLKDTYSASRANINQQ
jgi:hypothetical protein